MGRIKSTVFSLVGLIIIVCMISNYFVGELSPFGCIIILLGVGFLLLPFVARVVKKLSKRCYHIFSIILYCVLAVIISLTAIMVSAAHDNLKNVSVNAAVVVPGCFIHGDKPGDMLQHRLDTAEKYLKAHPKTICVVCGGYIGNYTQAEVMKKYLVQKGISASRIRSDDKSDTTYENLKNAKALLPGKKDIIISTDVYHQYRAKYYAKRLGFTPYALPSKTPLRHYVDSWPREYLAIIKAWLTGI